MSAGIFVVLALGWAGYLIPRALKHHDEVARTRSVDRFSQTMRVLSRREVVAPARAADNPRVVVPADRPNRVRLQAQRRAAASAARRRRRILIVLLLADVAVGSLVYLGTLQRWSIAIPAGLTLLYLVLCRTLVKREHSSFDAEKARASIRARQDAEDEATPAVRIRNPQGYEEFSADEDTAAIDVSAIAAPTADGASLWDPLPVTLPTYVGKPIASRTVRTIDLSAPGVSSSGHDAGDSELVAQAEQKPADPEVPEQRAVNS
ncbi:MAG TPA: hypothetical protein VLI04_03120 [Nocardioidaceae bacterium]|nr:hypothetical protein [Nocardioidaceae bacterium]